MGEMDEVDVSMNVVRVRRANDEHHPFSGRDLRCSPRQRRSRPTFKLRLRLTARTRPVFQFHTTNSSSLPRPPRPAMFTPKPAMNQSGA